MQLPIQLKAEELYEESRGDFVSFVAGRIILQQEETSVTDVERKLAFLRFSVIQRLGVRAFCFVLFFIKSNRSQWKNGYVLSIH